ncbi:putative K domain-containing protein [Helianthus annuus]|uniref:K domain-containing protein n=2 Tax=Helianthus annuus TaxID=4232 RepID=A0A9K3H996_HELAN|nr:putative K domain-containing protein [Helianthus annuus]KAJ0841773.1 putative K domain-containing protein [Helianthus annuus]
MGLQVKMATPLKELLIDEKRVVLKTATQSLVVLLSSPKLALWFKGRVIGRGGASIKSVREASGARVDVDDTRCDECIVTVQATIVCILFWFNHS